MSGLPDPVATAPGTDKGDPLLIPQVPSVFVASSFERYSRHALLLDG
jgi:hypothetical protein